jgi:hypothetical protein
MRLDDSKRMTSRSAPIATRRFTSSRPCPVCGGDQTKPVGSGERCWGYWLPGNDRVVCTRDEYANDHPADGGGWYHDVDSVPVRVATAETPERHDASAEADPLGWLATYVGVPRAFLDAIPVEARGSEIAFLFGDGMPAKMRRAGGKKIRWHPEGAPIPPLWPMPLDTNEASAAIIVEGETDCIAWWASISAAGLEHVMRVFTLTKGAGQKPDNRVFDELKERGVTTLFLAFDPDTSGSKGLEAWLGAAASAGMRAYPGEPQGRLALRGEKDARDVFRRLGDLELVERSPSWKRMGAWLEDAPSALDWVIEYLAARGTTCMLAGPMKGGKTTWLGNALRDAKRGQKFMGAWKTAPDLPILYFTEEGQVTAKIVIGDLDIDVISRRDHPDWPLSRTIAEALAWVDDHPGGLVVVDTYDKWAGIEDENATGENVAAIMALNVIAHAGAALLIVHHSRKGGGDYGEGIRGAGGILGAVDGAVELKYYRKGSDRRRIEFHGRMTENDELLADYERSTKEYTLVDESAEQNAELLAHVAGVPRSGDGVSSRWLEEHWGIEDGRSRIETLIQAGMLRRSDEMVKVNRGREYRYWRSDLGSKLTDGPPVDH